jgi:hypothetical protein
VPAQVAQPPPVPLTEWLPPLFPLLIAENREMARLVFALLQCVHAAGASDLLMGRSLSNVVSQSPQRYSYSGILELPRGLTFRCGCPEPSAAKANGGVGFGPQSGLLYNGLRIRSSAMRF